MDTDNTGKMIMAHKSAPEPDGFVETDEKRMDLVPLNAVTREIIGAAYRVSNTLGVGFLEKVYENAMVHELCKRGLRVAQQQPLRVYYDGVVVGDYVADLIVEACILVELKATKEIAPIYEAQCINYLKATDLKICLLFNFGTPKVGIKRIVI